jgi:23S rRNA (pseudouridine1915-N3)-methyltransferase
MHVLLCAIGKAKSGPHQSVYDYYTRRLAWKVTLKEWELKKPVTSRERKEQEGEWLLNAAKDCEHSIALDEKGRELTSVAFASHLQKQRENGVRSIAFLIGGADGLHETVLARAHLTLCLGHMTWPHMLVRALLAEQLYRAYTISTGHPYHRE